MLLIGVGIGRMTRVDSASRSPVATTTVPAPVKGTDSTESTGPIARPSAGTSTAPVAVNELEQTGAPRQPGNRPGANDDETAARSGWRGDRPANSGAAALPYRVAAVQHLTRAEALLTSYEAEARAGRQDDQMQAWSKDLLSTTRLLMDSPAGRDPKLRPLLEDLELVLAQIQQATTGHTSDREIVVEGMQKRGVLPRLRTAIPAGPSAGI
jgi:hypothetical protein